MLEKDCKDPFHKKCCSICLENDMIEKDLFVLDDCKHEYHTKCIMEWFRKGNKTCPLCRSEPEHNEKEEENETLGIVNIDVYIRLIFQSLLDVLENDSEHQQQYLRFQILFQSYTTISNVNRTFVLEMVKILISLFSFRIKLQVLCSLFLASTCSIIIVPILSSKVLFEEMVKYVRNKLESRHRNREMLIQRAYIIRRFNID